MPSKAGGTTPSGLEPGRRWYEHFVVGLDAPAQVIPFGAMSMAGFGDGAYRAQVASGAGGNVAGVRIVFIGKGDDGEKLRAAVRRVFGLAK